MTDDRRRMVTNGEAWKRTGMSSLVTAILTAGSLIGYWQVNPPRDDPFKGAEANAMRLELEAKMDMRERRILNRIVTIEGRDEQIALAQVEIWRALRELPPPRWQRRVENLEVWVLKKDPAYELPP